MFQCSMMFTLPFLTLEHPFPSIIYDDFDENWRDYDAVKNIIADKHHLLIRSVDTESSAESFEYTESNIKDPLKNILLIKWKTRKYTSSDLILDYFNRVLYCEIVSRPTWFDGVPCQTSLIFLLHDLHHVKSFLSNCDGIEFEEVKHFYIWLVESHKNGSINSDIFKVITAFIYFEIHEGDCNIISFSLESSMEMIEFQENENPGLGKNFSQSFENPLDLKGLVGVKKDYFGYFKWGKKMFYEYLNYWKHWERVSQLSYSVRPIQSLKADHKVQHEDGIPRLSYSVRPMRAGLTKRKRKNKTRKKWRF